MKRLFLLLILVTMSLNAQQTNSEKQTITVTGNHYFPIEAVKYRGKITFSLSESAYSGTPYSSLDAMKEDFYQDLDRKGIDKSKVTENRQEFVASGRSGLGTLMQMITTDIDEIQAFSAVKFAGSYVTSIDMIYKPSENQGTIIRKAQEDALANAKQVASELNKKVGPIVKVDSFYQTPASYDKFTYYNVEGQYSITITYELID